MATNVDAPDTGDCPLLGLAGDRQTHFMYPHPAHRCFASDRPAETDAVRQATYCLGGGHQGCDRYQARQRRMLEREGSEGRAFLGRRLRPPA
jgi:hypothetical protein